MSVIEYMYKRMEQYWPQSFFPDNDDVRQPEQNPRRRNHREQKKVFYDFSQPPEVITWANDITDEFVYIEMGSARAKKILNPHSASYFDRKLDSFWKTERDGFPGSLAVSLLKKDLSILESEPYHILPKSDGIRYMMVAFTNEKGEYVIDMIDRSGSHCIISLTFKAGVFSGTILDGELVKTTSGNYEYQVFDCIMSRGTTFSRNADSTRHVDHRRILLNTTSGGSKNWRKMVPVPSQRSLSFCRQGCSHSRQSDGDIVW